MSKSNAAFVFVHGAWHNHATWDRVVPILNALGFATETLDLPGAGVNARAPASFRRRPFDAAAFASEPSPNAGVTQEERTDAVIAAVEKAADAGNGKVVLVGHSLGGLTISDAAECIPTKLHALVYLTAFMLPNGMPAIAMIQHESMAASTIPDLLVANPAEVGAWRINVASDDPAYVAAMRETLYGDVAVEDLGGWIANLHCDEPAGVGIRPSAATAERFGGVTRHYIRCTGDNAITIAGQDHMIAAIDQATGGHTIVHTLATSHSPFASRPAELAGILATTAN